MGNKVMKYEIVIAKQYLCVPACLSTVINAMCNINISQYDIANFLGVNVPIGERIDFVNNISTTEKSADIGVIIKGNEINELFEYFEIPLTERYLSAYRIYPDDFAALVKKEISKNNSVICGFSYGFLYGCNNLDIGHVSIISGVSEDCTYITLIDPGPDDYGFKKVETSRLFESMRLKKNGIWVISYKR